MKGPMVILGIDPGSRKTGYAVIETEGHRLIYRDSGVLSFQGEFLQRPRAIYQSMEQIVGNYRPGEIALESLIYVKDVIALAKLAQARGAILAALCTTSKGNIFEYAPNEVKQTVAGHGHARKENMEHILRRLFKKGLEGKNFKTHDESDALGLALCHALLQGQPTSRRSKKMGTLGEAFKHLGTPS